MGETEGGTGARRAGEEKRLAYEAAVDSMQQGLLILSADGHVTCINQRMVSLLGLPRSALLGASLYSLVYQADHARLGALFAGRSGASPQVELRLRKAGDDLVTALVSITSVAASQKVCLVSDLSLQKRHEAADERTRKFLGMLAHELRNMLGPIRNAAAYLKAVDGLDARSTEMVDAIDRQSARMAALVEDLRRINPKE